MRKILQYKPSKPIHYQWRLQYYKRLSLPLSAMNLTDLMQCVCIPSSTCCIILAEFLVQTLLCISVPLCIDCSPARPEPMSSVAILSRQSDDRCAILTGMKVG